MSRFLKHFGLNFQYERRENENYVIFYGNDTGVVNMVFRKIYRRCWLTLFCNYCRSVTGGDYPAQTAKIILDDISRIIFIFS